jgi:nitroimidazol reductase NimA-like FMN-containing flavoprotein (pyridoxamine 5'-phosphate oxidase superfamily)
MGIQTQIKRHPEREVTEEYKSILQEGLIAHTGFCIENVPYVIPMSYDYDINNPERIVLHGSQESRVLKHLEEGNPVCIEVTLLDGLVFSKTAMFHSMNYRSVMCFGRSKLITDNTEKQKIFERMISRYFPGRTENVDYAAPPIAHLESTKVIEVIIESFSAKARKGNPKGPNDYNDNLPFSAGVKEIN